MKRLTREQEALAITIIKQGGPEGEQAKQMFVYFNQPLVGSVASGKGGSKVNYRGKGLTWEELLSAGNVGLLQAVNRFDPSQGYKFSTFAWPWIEGEIKQLFASTKRQKVSEGRIRRTDSGVPLVFDDADEKEELEDERLTAGISKDVEAQNEPESNKLIDHADLQEAVAQNADTVGGLGLNAQQARAEGLGSNAGSAEFSVSLRGEDASEDPSAGSGFGIEFVADWSQCDWDYFPISLDDVEEALQRFEDPRQAKVLAMRLGLNGQKQHTFAEIGVLLGVSTQRAYDIQKAAVAALRDDPTLQLLLK